MLTQLRQVFRRLDALLLMNHPLAWAHSLHVLIILVAPVALASLVGNWLFFFAMLYMFADPPYESNIWWVGYILTILVVIVVVTLVIRKLLGFQNQPLHHHDNYGKRGRYHAYLEIAFVFASTSLYLLVPYFVVQGPLERMNNAIALEKPADKVEIISYALFYKAFLTDDDFAISVVTQYEISGTMEVVQDTSTIFSKRAAARILDLLGNENSHYGRITLIEGHLDELAALHRRYWSYDPDGWQRLLSEEPDFGALSRKATQRLQDIWTATAKFQEEQGLAKGLADWGVEQESWTSHSNRVKGILAAHEVDAKSIRRDEAAAIAVVERVSQTRSKVLEHLLSGQLLERFYYPVERVILVIVMVAWIAVMRYEWDLLAKGIKETFRGLGCFATLMVGALLFSTVIASVIGSITRDTLLSSITESVAEVVSTSGGFLLGVYLAGYFLVSVSMVWEFMQRLGLPRNNGTAIGSVITQVAFVVLQWESMPRSGSPRNATTATFLWGVLTPPVLVVSLRLLEDIGFLTVHSDGVYLVLVAGGFLLYLALLPWKTNLTLRALARPYESQN